MVVGGGTGSHTILSGLRRLDLDLTAVVSVMDSGGSSGRLRDEYGFLPPGDARQCLVALADDQEAATILRDLFSYRFRGWRADDPGDGARSLDGHNLGNLFISALTDITGSVELAYLWAGRILGARGRVIPVTTSSVNLCARLTDGHVLKGESAIDVRAEHRDADISYVFLDRAAYPTRSATAALASADLVILGPGDLYTSVVPNLLVDGITEAIAAAQHRIFIVNLMTKPGETDGFKASTFVERLLDYLGPTTLDAAIVNTLRPSAKILERYAAEGALPVELDSEAIESMGIEVVPRPVASAHHFVRHDPVRLSETVLEWLHARQAKDGRGTARNGDATTTWAIR